MTITFTALRHARAFFEALAADNLDIGRPDNMEIIFQPAGPLHHQGRLPHRRRPRQRRRGHQRLLPHSRIKTYLKDGRALRIETVINDAYIGVLRRIAHFGELTAKAVTSTVG